MLKHNGTYQKRNCDDPIIFGEMLVELKNKGMTQTQIAKDLQRNRQMVGRYQKIGLWPDTLKQLVKENRECINNTAIIKAAIKYRNAEDVRTVFEELIKSSPRKLKLIPTGPKKSVEVPSKKRVLKKRTEAPEKINFNTFSIENGSSDTSPPLDATESILESSKSIENDSCTDRKIPSAVKSIHEPKNTGVEKPNLLPNDVRTSINTKWSFFAYVLNDVPAIFLIAMICALSYILVTFQIRAYSELPEFKNLQNVTAICVEVLLIVLSGLSVSGGTVQRLTAILLFLSLSVSTVYLLHRSNKSNELSQTEKLIDDEQKNTDSNEQVVSKKDKIKSLKTKIGLLMYQLDPTKANTYAAKGENGNLRITRQEISAAEAKIETLESDLIKLQEASSAKTSVDKQIKIIENDTYLNLVLRVLLLLSSAFLVHVVLKRFEAFKQERVIKRPFSVST